MLTKSHVIIADFILVLYCNLNAYELNYFEKIKCTYIYRAKFYRVVYTLAIFVQGLCWDIELMLGVVNSFSQLFYSRLRLSAFIRHQFSQLFFYLYMSI